MMEMTTAELTKKITSLAKKIQKLQIEKQIYEHNLQEKISAGDVELPKSQWQRKKEKSEKSPSKSGQKAEKRVPKSEKIQPENTEKIKEASSDHAFKEID
jgi:hypothetical protein